MCRKNWMQHKNLVSGLFNINRYISNYVNHYLYRGKHNDEQAEKKVNIDDKPLKKNPLHYLL